MQPDHVMVVSKGDNVNLTCLCTYHEAVLWFKQIIGWKPVLIVTSYPHSFILNNKDQTLDTKRLHVIRGANSCNLTITQTQLEDSATYYCAQVFGITFGDGTLLIVKGKDLINALHFFPYFCTKAHRCHLHISYIFTQIKTFNGTNL